MSSRAARSLSKLFSYPARTAGRCHRHLASRRKLGFEPLETRRVLATLWVDPSVPPTPTIFSKIGDAVTAAHSGDTIKVVGGTYMETISVSKPLTIIGGQVRVPGTSGASIIQNSPVPVAFFLDANNITIKDFTIQQESIGIITSASFSGYRIVGNSFNQNKTSISINSSPTSTAQNAIAGNSLESFGGASVDSIRVDTSVRNLTISGNSFLFDDSDAAIAVTGSGQSNNVRILSNQFASSAGIILTRAANSKANGNTFDNPVRTPIQLTGAVTSSEASGNILFDSAASPPDGIELQGTGNSGNKIRSNSIQGFNHGVNLFAGTMNTVSANNISHSTSDGILLSFNVSANILSGNTLTNNAANGINVQGVGLSSNTINKNSANSNAIDGIRVSGAGGCTVWGNTANYNGQTGINIDGGDNTMVAGNTAGYNGSAGIKVQGGSSNDNLSGNITNFNSIGIDLAGSDHNMLSSNSAKNNHDLGFSIQGGSNMLAKNIAVGNLGNGFEVLGGSNVLTSNMASFNRFDGFLVELGSSNMLKMNTANSNGGAGIQLDQSDSNVVSGNSATSNHSDGIAISDSSHNMILSNRAKNNVRDGIDVAFGQNLSMDNTIKGNTATGNGQATGGFDLFDASGTTIFNVWSGNIAGTRFPAGLL